MKIPLVTDERGLVCFQKTRVVLLGGGGGGGCGAKVKKETR